MDNSAVKLSPSPDVIPRTYADLILKYLEDIGVGCVFGVPGGAIEPLYNALARHNRQKENDTPLEPLTSYKSLIRSKKRDKRDIEAIISRHECGAAYMAEGYARETGKLGVCCSTTGPGATNLLTGVASAYAERIPMLVITAQTALPNFGKLALQESSSDVIDTVGMFEHCTNYNSLISHSAQIERKLTTAILYAYRKPRGPSHISIPMDILNQEITSNESHFQIGPLLRQPSAYDEQTLKKLYEEISQSKKIVIVVGNDAGEASELITHFAEITQSQIVTTPGGKSWINPYHDLYRGIFGFAGHTTAKTTLIDKDVDLVLLIGTNLSELETSAWDEDALLNERAVHIDNTLENFTRSPMARLHVFGNLKTIFSKLNSEIQDYSKRIIPLNAISKAELVPKKESSIKLLKHLGIDYTHSNNTPIKPQQLMLELANRFPSKTKFVADAGNSWAWMTHYLHTNNVKKFHIGMGFGAMAWAIGAAVGIAFGDRKSPVVCVTGDGSFLMSGQELTVAVQHKLNVIFVILNDAALGMVKHGQRLGGAEQIGFKLPPVNFRDMAIAMGAQAFTINQPSDFDNINIDNICNRGGPTLLDVYIDAEEVPPMGTRMKVLNNMHSK